MIYELQPILSKVRRPGRYIGGELNQIIPKEAAVRVALAFPDVYEVGMSNLGLAILYEIINATETFSCERVFAPWIDMEEQLRAAGLPLFSLETKSPLRDFDVLGFSFQYELTFTNVLNMIELAGIDMSAAKRSIDDPLIIAGGPCVFNPEPMAPFIDAFVVGEAEEAVIDLLNVVNDFKEGGGDDSTRRDLLAALAKVDGVYVPGLYERRGAFPLADAEGSPLKIKRRIIKDFNRAPIPRAPIVPFLETIHDRCVIEVMRGCTRGCRFCQAGIVYRPARERSAETVTAAARMQTASTGYEEVSLASLSTTDHSEIVAALEGVGGLSQSPAWRVSLPSMRTDRFSVELAQKIAGAKKSGLTFAPEAGTQRLRDVINKGLTEEEVLEAAVGAFGSGWSRIKLYFMIGLPTETDEDVLGIADLVYKILDATGEELGVKAAKRIKIAVSVSTMVPKAHSPFQWAGAIGIDEIERRQGLLKDALRSRQVDLKWHDAMSSQLEAALAKGGRELAPVIERAHRLGARFDGWSEYFSYDLWQQAFASAGMDIEAEAGDSPPLDAPLPWDHIDSGITRAWLAKEYAKAVSGAATVDCRLGECSSCGVCKGGVRMEIAAGHKNDKSTS